MSCKINLAHTLTFERPLDFLAIVSGIVGNYILTVNGLRLADYTSQPISVHSCIHRTTPSLQLIWRCWACRMLKVLISIGTIGLTTCKLYLYDHLLTVYLDADFRMYSDLTVKMYAHATLTLSTVSTCNALSFSIPNWTDLKPQSVKWLHFICCG